MLFYSSLYDPYHAALRMIAILISIQPNVIEKEKIKILDTYLAAPALIGKLRFPINLLNEKKSLSRAASPYDQYYDPHKLFRKLEKIQEATLWNLASRGIISIESLKSDIVSLDAENITDSLLDTVISAKSINENVLYFLTNHLIDLPLLGPNGLKDRSGLMEYRYDAV